MIWDLIALFLDWCIGLRCNRGISFLDLVGAAVIGGTLLLATWPDPNIPLGLSCQGRDSMPEQIMVEKKPRFPSSSAARMLDRHVPYSQYWESLGTVRQGDMVTIVVGDKNIIRHISGWHVSSVTIETTATPGEVRLLYHHW